MPYANAIKSRGGTLVAWKRPSGAGPISLAKLPELLALIDATSNGRGFGTGACPGGSAGVAMRSSRMCQRRMAYLAGVDGTRVARGPTTRACRKNNGLDYSLHMRGRGAFRPQQMERHMPHMKP